MEGFHLKGGSIRVALGEIRDEFGVVVVESRVDAPLRAVERAGSGVEAREDRELGVSDNLELRLEKVSKTLIRLDRSRKAVSSLTSDPLAMFIKGVWVPVDLDGRAGDGKVAHGHVLQKTSARSKADDDHRTIHDGTAFPDDKVHHGTAHARADDAELDTLVRATVNGETTCRDNGKLERIETFGDALCP